MDYTNNKIRQRCEGCNELYLPREVGDMADLNNLCRDCAAECAHQLEVDYNLPEGCSDEERQAGMTPAEGATTWVLICNTTNCIRYGQVWTTVLSPEEWYQRHGRPHHCFRCGADSHLVTVHYSEDTVGA